MSCNPFISKDLRRKNKCNRKIDKVNDRYDRKTKKIAIYCPEILHKDTIRDTLRIEIPKLRIDSFIVIQKDTAEIDSLLNLIASKKTRTVIKKYITNYVPLKDTIIHEIEGYTFKFFNSGGNIAYRVEKPLEVIETTSEVVIEDIQKVELTIEEKIMNFLSRFWLWIVIVSISFILIRYLSNIFSIKK